MDIFDFTDQLRDFAPMLGLGFVLGAVYDFIRIVRLFVSSKKIFIFITDIFFMLFCAASSYLLFIAVLNGRIRGYAVVGEIIGAVMYFLSIGSVIYPFFRKIQDRLKKFFRKLFAPLIYVSRKIKAFAVNSAKKSFERTEKLFEELKNSKKLKKSKNKLKKPLQDDSNMLYNNND